MKEKPLFTAYEAWPERIYLLYMACFFPYAAFVLAWNMWDRHIPVNLEIIICAAVSLLLTVPCVVYAFKPRTRIYASGLKITGYPFFAWGALKRARFVYLSNARNAISPDEELELIPVDGLTFTTSFWRRLLLREDYNKKIIVPFWSLSASTRARLLEELRLRISAPDEAVLRLDEKARLLLRGVFFTAFDIFFLLAAVAGGYLLWMGLAA